MWTQVAQTLRLMSITCAFHAKVSGQYVHEAYISIFRIGNSVLTFASTDPSVKRNFLSVDPLSKGSCLQRCYHPVYFGQTMSILASNCEFCTTLWRLAFPPWRAGRSMGYMHTIPCTWWAFVTVHDPVSNMNWFRPGCANFFVSRGTFACINNYVLYSECRSV